MTSTSQQGWQFATGFEARSSSQKPPRDTEENQATGDRDGETHSAFRTKPTSPVQVKIRTHSEHFVRHTGQTRPSRRFVIRTRAPHSSQTQRCPQGIMAWLRDATRQITQSSSPDFVVESTFRPWPCLSHPGQHLPHLSHPVAASFPHWQSRL